MLEQSAQTDWKTWPQHSQFGTVSHTNLIAGDQKAFHETGKARNAFAKLELAKKGELQDKTQAEKLP